MTAKDTTVLPGGFEQKWIDISGTIPASGSLDIALSDESDFEGLEIILVLVGSTFHKKLNVSLVKDGSDLKDSVYGKLNPRPRVDVNFEISGSEVLMKFVNSETFDVTYFAEYIKI